MPRFIFDLFFDRHVVLDPSGMLFERKAGARATAEQMARHLATARAELRYGRGWIRVRDARRNEVHRQTIDPYSRSDIPGEVRRSSRPNSAHQWRSRPQV